MRTIYHAQNLIDAHLVKNALEQEDIPAFIAGEYLTGAVGQLPALDLVAVQVADACVAPAEVVVKRVEAQLAQARQAIADWDDPLMPLAT
jgi:acetyl-CoA acetyltransferase